MNDYKNLNQPNNNSEDYQKILDQAAASVKPEDVENTPPTQEVTDEKEPTAKLKEIDTSESEEQPKLKDINSLQLEAPNEQPLPASISDDTKLTDKPELEIKPSVITDTFDKDTLKTSKEPEISPPIPNQEPNISEEIPKTDVQPDVEKHELPPVYNPPKEKLDVTEEEETPKTPEEVKAQIDKILTDDSTNNDESNDPDSSTELPKKSNNLKTIFIISLIIFFVVAALWVYFLFFYQPETKNSDSVTPTIIPTKAISQEVCELNGETYQVGESFASEDGCNTCTCQSAGVIACTEMACSLTPTTTVSTSTQSATVSPTRTTVSPTKSATSSVTPSTSL